MNLKSGNWRNLPRAERIIARIARQAVGNTIIGGCSALVLAKRLHAMGGTDLRYVVGDVYSASTGRNHPEHGAWECPECGQTYLGQDAAWKCCNQEEE